MIVTSIRAKTTKSALKEIRKAKAIGADIAELRLDYIENPDLKKLFRNNILPVIATARPKWEGGNFSGSEDERIALLREAARLGANYIDLEFRAYKDFPLAHSKLILSYHNFSQTPANVNAIISKMRELKPHIIKVVTKANSIRDVIYMAELQRKTNYPSAIFCMGEFGLSLRILYKKFGSMLTYSTLATDKATAEGQPLLEDLLKIYNAKNITRKTKVYALVGNPVSYSKSPLIFNRVYKERKQDCRYVPICVDDISLIRKIIVTFNLSGISVTIPHKSSIIKYLDEINEDARGIGAINTVEIRKGKLIGHNTDSPAAVECVRSAVRKKFKQSLWNKNVLLVGAGGAARAIAWGLAARGAKIMVTNRTYAKAEELAKRVGGMAIRLRKSDAVKADVIINATSLGMHPNTDVSPLGKNVFNRNMVVFDCVYTPTKTKFLRLAKSKGAEIVYGTSMFYYQAILQYEIFTGGKLTRMLLKAIG